MRIAYALTRSDHVSGPQVHLLDLAGEMLKHGHEATVLTGGDGPFLNELDAAGIPCERLQHMSRAISPRRDLRAFLELKKQLSRLKPHLVSTHSSKAGVLGRAAARALRIPAIHTAHGWAHTSRCSRLVRMGYYASESLAARWGARTIVVSGFDRGAAVADASLGPSRVWQIHNGVREIPTKYRARPDIGPPVVTMVARLEPQKDHATLLQALSCLCSHRWKLQLVGAGRQRRGLESLAGQLGLADRVRFLGHRLDVYKLLAGSAVFVLASKWEGLPRSILEANRAGLPVVASAVGGVAEAVVDGVSGFLVPQGRVDSLASALGELLRSRRLRKQFGKEARSLYERRFRFSRMYAETTALYAEVLREAVPG